MSQKQQSTSAVSLDYPPPRDAFPKASHLTCSAAVFLTSALLGGELLAGGAEECGLPPASPNCWVGMTG